jgi:cytochrome P450
MVDGHVIPEGMTVTVLPNAIHHNKKYYPRSSTFWPERWIPGSRNGEFIVTEETLNLAKSAFFPFSTGTRGCIGKNMAYMELLITTARMVFLYDMRRVARDCRGEADLLSNPVTQRPGEFKTLDWFITQRDGPIIEFKRRQV